MHAPVLLRQVEQAAHGACDAGAAPQVQRVEHTNLNLWMRRQGGDGDVLAVAGGVVEENAYTHAAVSSLEHFFHQHSRTDAVMHDVVLQI
ncbi:hypothetical protein D3C76_1592420 [compost metagenome]